MFKIKALFAVLAVTALGLTTFLTPANALGTPKPQQTVTWGWEDGADKSHRDFSEDDYDTVEDMPGMTVKVLPASLGRRVILESYDSLTATWSTDQSSRTDAAGVAKFLVDPYCRDFYSDAPAWCDHDVSFRLRVLKSGTQKVLLSKPFVVSFVASETSTF